MKNSPLNLRNFAITGAILLVILILLFTSGGDSVDSANEYYSVTRDDFMISSVQSGSLEAVNEISVRNEVDGTSRIVYMVPEGTIVKKGDLLVELDSSGADDQANQQRITYEKAELDLIQARQQLAIQESQARSDTAAADLQLTLAKIDLEKFNEKEKEQTQTELELLIKTTQGELAVAEETLIWSEKLHDQGFETKSTLDNNKLSVARLNQQIQKAANDLSMWEDFDSMKQETVFSEAVNEAERELERVKAQAASKLAQFEADVKTQTATALLQKSKLDRDLNNLEKTKIYSPAPGMVVYPMAEGRFSSESMIEEGATVRSRQVLVKLPDTSKMKITVKVHETDIGKIKPGLPAFVELQSLPDQRFNAYVGKVAILPDSQSRFGNPNLKVYNTEVIISDPLPSTVKPGVSAKAEIVITNLVAALRVPVQCVTTFKGKPVVYLAGKSNEPVPVEVGMFNTKFIEVVSGVKEGDRILLSPPLDSTPIDLEGSILLEGDELPSTNSIPVSIQKSAPEPSRPVAEGNEGGGGGGGRRFSPPQEVLDRFDKDGDGTLNDEERTAMIEQMRQAGGGGFGGGSGGGGQRRDRGDRQGGQRGE